MSTQKVKTVLVGVGGYGASYVSHLESGVLDINQLSIEGVVDPFAERSPHYALLKRMDIPFYATLSDFYAERDAQLAVISTPIHLHRGQTITAMQNGSDALCEKPLVTCMEDWEAIEQAERAAGRRVGVGFQWSFSNTMLSLKGDILAGRFGKPLRLKTLVCWPRPKSYYEGSSWKGRLYDTAGHFVNDSIVSNATAHYIHNIFFLMGSAIETAESPSNMRAELYRAKGIETFDTCFLKGAFPSGAEFFYAVSHAGRVNEEPQFLYEFENATVSFNTGKKDNVVRAQFKDGAEVTYGDPFTAPETAQKLQIMIDHVRDGAIIPCGVQTVRPHVHLCDALSKLPVAAFPDDLKVETEKSVFCPMLDDALHACYKRMELPSELDYRWSAGAFDVG